MRTIRGRFGASGPVSEAALRLAGGKRRRYHPAMLKRALLGGLLALAVAAHAAPPAKTSSSAKKAPAKAAHWKPAVPFIEDDFGRALALAKERKLPVFIEGWAPW